MAYQHGWILLPLELHGGRLGNRKSQLRLRMSRVFTYESWPAHGTKSALQIDECQSTHLDPIADRRGVRGRTHDFLPSLHLTKLGLQISPSATSKACSPGMSGIPPLASLIDWRP